MSAVEFSSELHPGSLIFYINKLTGLQWAIFRSGFSRLKPGRKLLYLGLFILVILLVAGIFILTTYLMRVINSAIASQVSPQLQAFVDAVPGLMFSLAFLATLMSSFAVLLQALYLANDMEFLLSAPIPIRAVFVSKLLQAILPNLVMVAALCLPILFGLGITENYSLLYYPLVICLLVVLVLAAAGIASLLVMAVVRIIPAKRVAEILGFLAAVLFIVLSQWTNLTGITSDSITSETLTNGAGVLTQVNQSWSPLAWAGRGLVEFAHGLFIQGSWHVLLVLAVCAGVFCLSLITAERLYYSGWASMQVSASHKKNTKKTADRQADGVVSRFFRNRLPAQVMPILIKDFKLLWRDLRSMSKIIMPLIMGIVFAVMLLRNGSSLSLGKIESTTLLDDLIRSGFEYGCMLIPVFVSWMLVVNLGTISFSMEGKYYWILKTAPVGCKRLLAAKYLVTFLPVLVVTWLYMVAIALVQQVPLSILAYSLPAAALILAGMVGFTLAFGVRFANMGWTDPRHMTDGAGSYLAMAAGIAYLILCFIIFIASPVSVQWFGLPRVFGQLAGLLIGGIVAIACMILPLAHIDNKVAVLGEG